MVDLYNWPIFDQRYKGCERLLVVRLAVAARC